MIAAAQILQQFLSEYLHSFPLDNRRSNRHFSNWLSSRPNIYAQAIHCSGFRNEEVYVVYEEPNINQNQYGGRRTDS